MLGTQDLVPDHLIKDWRHFNDRGRKAHLKTVTTRRPTDVSEEWYSKNIDEVHDENSNGDSNVEDGHKLYYKPIGEQLFDFQVEGIQWLLYNWAQHRGSILADEMGLGKTVQSSVFISAIHELTGGVGPCLVVAPLSTLTHWKRELAKWAPALRTVVFHGAQEERPLIQDYMLNWVNLNDGRSIKEKNVVKGKIDYK
ncbi:chromodomain helicase dna binding protein, putative [Perkinsus marinus ATCC 50983]|uniref:Chromodomain helicase dna binding protein, putative n=1 Tax=Perkinsus marinus (strain ATCC 50983 / TXsc) TaxID=423536 RepID=C5LCJ8_PERM5|nr:chromodomain helicase dna binding protein, putative [Perkinsus marinus ATCC 50983]EER05681.1 chromodomain helicase dna binding protein, putative [Perkinsus marinus ATCC 50983]|eukprot:XP_002773865.1 chromodomain helicase dna binding protein, putative [Perkinsus marinus ATCC 50983]